AFGCNVVLLRKHRATLDFIPSILLAGIFLMISTLPFALPLTVSAPDLCLLAALGGVQLGTRLLLYMPAVPHLSSAEIALISIIEIIFGVVSTWVFIGERPGDAALTGGGIVIAALAVNHFVGMRQAPPVPV